LTAEEDQHQGGGFGADVGIGVVSGIRRELQGTVVENELCASSSS
jgi:hypothetical protein